MLVGVMNNTTNTQSAQPAAHTPGPWILQIDENDIFVEVVDSPTEEPFLRPSRLMNSAMPTPALSLKWPTVCGCHRWNQLSKSMVGAWVGSICSTAPSRLNPFQHPLQLHQRPLPAPSSRYSKAVQLLNHLTLRKPLRLERLQRQFERLRTRLCRLAARLVIRLEVWIAQPHAARLAPCGAALVRVEI